MLPDGIDPARMGLNVLINDSDTQNQTVQVRVGWSTFRGVRADPWRWGLVTLDGLEDAGSDPKEAIVPSTAALSIDSPESILQSAGDRVPLGSGTGLPQILVQWVAHGGAVPLASESQALRDP